MSLTLNLTTAIVVQLAYEKCPRTCTICPPKQATEHFYFAVFYYETGYVVNIHASSLLMTEPNLFISLFLL